MNRAATQQPQNILLDQLDLLTKLDRSQPVLDLACGTGRNGLLLAENGIAVVFADISAPALAAVNQRLDKDQLPGRTWQVDLEQQDVNPFSGQSFSAIIGFNYLHRPLFPALMDAVIPGGLVIYETFTTGNRQFGRPNNPDFLLRPAELETIFKEWEIIHHFEGIARKPDRAIAQIVARKSSKH